uniref:G-protein coupled receptors family 1 profile domain-containing protein n=1 Tax=Cavia porcellus TaxID=10141 RepID=A0A286Y4T2_CAVPO
MLIPNNSEIKFLLLIRIPGLDYAHMWISIPICLMYLVAITGNCIIIFIIRTEPSLHEPMFFLFNATGISPTTCFAQEFFIHGFTVMESSVLLIMSLGCFLAIHNPLRYSSILTNKRVAKMGLILAIRNILLNFLSHSYCLQDIMKLACSDNKTNFMYGFFVALCTMLGLAFIFVSYVLILKTVLSTASLMERLKALNTCVSHICAVLIFYVAIITLGAIHCFAKHKNPLVTVLIADMFLLVPPLMNSIVYCVKTRQIHEKVLRKFLNICER